MPTPTTRALVVHGPGDLRIDEVALPAPAPHEAVLDVVYGGICGSDLAYRRHGRVGESVLRAPMVLGHEVVARVREEARDGSGPPAGAAVTVFPATPCGSCDWCRAGRTTLCPTTTYLGSAARFPHTEGAFAEQVVIAADRLRALPASLPWTAAALVEPAAVAWHAVARAGDVRGRRVLVVGAGPIGLLVVAVLKQAGAEVVAVDVRERPLEVARSVGADAVLPSPPPSDLEVDVAIDSSGSAPGVAAAVSALRRGGHLVLLGLPPTPEQPFPSGLVATRELSVTGSFRFDRPELDRVVDALADGRLDVGPVISHVLDLDEAEAAFDTAADAGVSSKVLLRIGVES